MPNTRDQIIETTCELLEMQGYHATGLNQIVKESGSPKGSLYHYFPGGKEELTAEAIEKVGHSVLARLEMTLEEIEDPAEAVRAFMMRVAHHIEISGYRAGGPITTVASETASTSERLRQTCQEVYGLWQRAIATKLASRGIAEDQAGRLAMLTIATLEGGILLSRTAQSPQPLLDLAEYVATLIRQAERG
ncbi:MAG: TetR/AcrR family transcriptional regulator [Anaerolineae bacterium]|jgi:TetR/AcrR family transcriptional repressor of lmrAB and yxaGH operons|nr:TetR/AcrR family transcriptional regulator [Anaerolineae bacterium]